MLAVRAIVWGYPLVRAAELREKSTQPDRPYAPRPPTVATAPINHLGLARALADPDTRIGVAPNNDTLYALAFLDTAAGPFQLDTPDFGDRYYVFQFGDADSETRQSFGQSSHGRRLPPIFIVGPAYSGSVPAGALLVRSRQRYLMVAGRILTDGAADLPRVHGLQDRIRLTKWLAPGHLVEPPITPQRRLPDGPAGDPLRWLARLGTVLRDWRTEPDDAALAASLQAIGLASTAGFREQDLSPKVREEVRRGVRDGLAAIAAKTRALGAVKNGWSTNYAGSRFGGDYLLRAAVAMDQIYVLDRKEALYPVAHRDGHGHPLDGRTRYTICFRRQDLPPVNAFWSITLYYAKGFLVPNARRRYSIGDRTPGLTYGKDGSLRIHVQSDDPGAAGRSNWLPAPAEKFMLMMRLYRPRPDAMDGQWHPPAIMPSAVAKGDGAEACGAP
ncbi:DUF1254 domain-containing protein [Sphingomonas sanxanigenens]|uniref:DUF1254 domain-containing protein n=1 Tax=Sphingomonas sanxanigenens DSM 19645 = NX02 TaxID=1123269 RepID=W0A4Y9_9SPHN|nr:DUF1214 domain-containing protein [Sphingomonas sanxanigenens]AHE52999.1 hypothetical protein NX02_06345 [Sphingomonas sanxanigenens DSM 19645 = NX02]